MTDPFKRGLKEAMNPDLNERKESIQSKRNTDDKHK